MTYLDAARRAAVFNTVPHPAPTSAIRRAKLLEQPRFGQVFTDHMVTIAFDAELGWHSPTVGPLRELSLHPATAALHYAQEVFEGMKAFRHPDGGVVLFRPDQHAARFNRSLRRMAMPELPEDLFVEAVRRLVEIDADWVPNGPGQALYLRPFAFATDTMLGGGRASSSYLFVVLASPSGVTLADRPSAISVWVQETFVRAAAGGTGEAKAGANYAGALLGMREGVEHGCDQVVWLDAAERRWVEEAGAMNLFFVVDDGTGPRLLTPALTGTFLPGITRLSVLELAAELGFPVAETKISVDDWRRMARSGELTEAFASGTATAVVGIGRVRTAHDEWTIGDGVEGPVTQMLRNQLVGLQRGIRPDSFGWVEHVVPARAVPDQDEER